jgi:hypothetical protein
MGIAELEPRQLAPTVGSDGIWINGLAGFFIIFKSVYSGSVKFIIIRSLPDILFGGEHIASRVAYSRPELWSRLSVKTRRNQHQQDRI